ncbi:MAG: metallophosphoesterase family protein [Candidatus Eiseniibacteriota bacterium]
MGSRSLGRAIGFFGVAALAAAAVLGMSWPRTSTHPVSPLDHPTIESRMEQTKIDPKGGFEFLAFGDQRELIENDWPAMIDMIAGLAAQRDRLLFLVDTGDIVDDGAHSDQFRTLADLLRKVGRLPYLAAAGNHEVDQNVRGPARANVASFLSKIGEPVTPDRLYYKKVVGRVRFLFLDSNDWVYDEGFNVDTKAVTQRAHEQLEWLVRELADPAFGPAATTIVVMHHPIIQSSEKHRDHARRLWNFKYHGRRLADIFADGGVDLVLVGHTHTYERFTVTRKGDGRAFDLVNLSGKPEPSFLWFGAGERRAEDLRGNEAGWLYEHGWTGLDGWTVAQNEVITKDELDQCGLFHVEGDGGITLSMCFLGRKPVEPPVRLLWGVSPKR